MALSEVAKKRWRTAGVWFLRILSFGLIHAGRAKNEPIVEGAGLALGGAADAVEPPDSVPPEEQK